MSEQLVDGRYIRDPRLSAADDRYGGGGQLWSLASDLKKAKILELELAGRGWFGCGWLAFGAVGWWACVRAGWARCGVVRRGRLRGVGGALWRVVAALCCAFAFLSCCPVCVCLGLVPVGRGLVAGLSRCRVCLAVLVLCLLPLSLVLCLGLFLLVFPLNFLGFSGLAAFGGVQ